MSEGFICFEGSNNVLRGKGVSGRTDRKITLGRANNVHTTGCSNIAVDHQNLAIFTMVEPVKTGGCPLELEATILEGENSQTGLAKEGLDHLIAIC